MTPTIPMLEEIDPEEFETDVALIRDALDPMVDAEMPYHVAITEIINTITEFTVSAADAEVDPIQDWSVTFDETGLLILRDAIVIDEADALAERAENDFYFAGDEYIPVDDDVIAIDRSKIYESIDGE